MKGCHTSHWSVTSLKIGYARVSTVDQDLTAQTDALTRLGVTDDRMYLDHGMTGANRSRPGLEKALAVCRSGDMLVVTKLDRLARSVRDASDIVDELMAKEVTLSIGGAIYDPTDPVGRLMFNVLSMVAEFERDLIRQRTREGMAVAKAKGRLKGKQPKLSASKQRHLVELHGEGRMSIGEIASLFDVSRATVYRTVKRADAASATADALA